MNHGGKRQGSGRKPKDEKLKLIEQMDAYMLPDELWSTLAELCKKKDRFALRTWIEYRYGKPKNYIELDTNSEHFTPIILSYGTNNEH